MLLAGMLSLACATAPAAPASAAGAASAAAAVPASACRGASMRPDATDLGAIGAATLCLVEGIRAADGLRPLAGNAQLARVAAHEARQLVALDYFADVGPSGQTAMTEVAASRYATPSAPFTVGQNLAWGTGPNTTPVRIVAAWMASPPHRAIILDPAFRDAGVAAVASAPAIVSRGHAGATYAMEFGVRR